MVHRKYYQEKSDTDHTISVHSSSSFSPVFYICPLTLNSKSQLLTEAWQSGNGVPKVFPCMFGSRYWSRAAFIANSYIVWLTFPPESALPQPPSYAKTSYSWTLDIYFWHFMSHYFYCIKKRFTRGLRVFFFVVLNLWICIPITAVKSATQSFQLFS